MKLNVFYQMKMTIRLFLEIHAGAGGTESQDWAEMLRRMYIKWTSNKGCKFQLISEHRVMRLE